MDAWAPPTIRSRRPAKPCCRSRTACLLNSTINGVLVTGDGIRVPLYAKVRGWTALNIRAGYPLLERVSLILGVGNVLDHNYRAIGSGVDAPGINAFAGVRCVF